jgi:HD-GYP domain-containing protein (c-di-GMP phosphodiesterase class II)
MNPIPLSGLVPNTYFDKPVYLDAGFILLTPDSAVTPDLLKRLQKWKFLEVLSEGRRKDLSGTSAAPGSGALSPQTIDEDIRENAQATAAQKFYTELTAFTTELFNRYTEEGELSLPQVNEWVKKTMVVVHDSRDYLMRCLDMGADGDRYIITHAVNSTILALAVADYLKAPPFRLIELGTACLLHEIGMFKLPGELRRSSKALSPEERKAMMAHTVLGYRILKGFSASENIALAALEHHERIDGTGYPRGLSAPKIADHALIIGVVCSYDAMVSRRPYRMGVLDGHATIKDLAQKNRKQYDEKILKALVYALSVYPVGTAVKLSNGSKGIVARTDPAKPRCPTVRALRDGDGRKLEPAPLVQVTETDGVSIVGVLGAEEARDLKENS